MFVGITDRLLGSVSSTIRTMAQREVQSLGDRPAVVVTEADIEQQLWGDYLHLRSEMPASWKVEVPTVTVRLHITTSDGAAHDPSFEAAVLGKASGPPTTSRYGPAVNLSELESMNEVKQYLTNIQEANNRWSKVKTDIMEFLRNAKSLNEALKLYPDIAIYIPQMYLDKVNEKKDASPKEPSKAAEILKGIDTDGLKAAAVISRMST